MTTKAHGSTELRPGREVSQPSENVPLSRIRTMSTLLDDIFRIPGTNIRFGLDPIVGILPVIGDTTVSFFSLYIVFESYRAGVPSGVLAKMLAIVAVDVVIGSVPVLGSLFDTFWKANSWNVSLLESHLQHERPRASDTSPA